MTKGREVAAKCKWPRSALEKPLLCHDESAKWPRREGAKPKARIREVSAKYPRSIREVSAKHPREVSAKCRRIRNRIKNSYCHFHDIPTKRSVLSEESGETPGYAGPPESHKTVSRLTRPRIPENAFRRLRRATALRGRP
eukprot:2317897-Prymnesium_polylepis.1